MPAVLPAYDDPSGKLEFRQRLGRCYELAGRFASHHDGVALIHGSIQGFGNPRIDHAWVELPDGNVWEPASGQVWDRAVFDVLYHPKVGQRFSHMDVLVNLCRERHWGPWDAPVRARTKGELKAGQPRRPVKEDQDLVAAFQHLHNQQRYGGPEDMFMKAYNPDVDLGTGLWRQSLELAGDLVHRSSYSGTSADFGGGGAAYGRCATLNKARTLLVRYQDKTFGAGVQEQLDNNYVYSQRHGFRGSRDEFRQRVRAAGERYAQAYERLVPVTYVQQLGRDIAIHTGRFEFAQAAPKLRELIRLLDRDDWERSYWTPLPGWRSSPTA